MLKSLLIASCLAALSACASLTNPSVPSPTPAQVAQQVCPVLQSTNLALTALPLPPSAMGYLVIAKTVVDTGCTVGAAITAGKLQAMSGQALPALISAIQGSGLSDSDKSKYILDLSAASVILNGWIALNPQWTSIGTSVPVAASAPAAK